MSEWKSVFGFGFTVVLWAFEVGAGEGNRTLISGLGSPHSTTEPHPPALRFGAAGPKQYGDIVFTRLPGDWQLVCSITAPRFPICESPGAIRVQLLFAARATPLCRRPVRARKNCQSPR